MPQVRSRPGRRGARGRTGFLGVLMGSVAMVAVIGVLSGCAAGDPEITPLPTSSVAEQSSSSTPTPEPTSGAYFAPEPQSEEEAIRQATEAYEFFLATVSEVYANPEDPSPIDEIAKQGAAEDIYENASFMHEEGLTLELHDSFELDSVRSHSLPMSYGDGTLSDFGTAHLYGCLDISGRSGQAEDGSAVNFPDQKRAIVHVVVIYEVVDGRWFIHSDAPEAGQPPC